MNGTDAAERIRAEALRLGFDRVAFAAAGPCRDAPHLRRWLEEGRHGDMAWMERTAEVRTDPAHLLPGARTVVSLLTFYPAAPSGEASEEARPWEGRVSRYAWGRDYHNVLGRRLRKLASTVRAWDGAPGAVPAVDAKPILEKEWAERAGLGWIGKHSNLITQDGGSWFFLSELVTDVECVPSEAAVPDRCGTCTACLDACPTGAIVAPREVDARACISYLTIEFDGVLPPETRPLVGEWIFGCDVCQEVCPWNRFAVKVEDEAFRFDRERFRGELPDLLALDRAAFEARFEGSPVRRAGRDPFLRNVCVALGNRRDASALGALGGALRDEAA
ncbi:tRNA epoxyqueuosine(34) reductase QueG, partial [bacterium]|nr:tRNA epoxyqueuosine(34) reductase QueG [bacterium]